MRAKKESKLELKCKFFVNCVFWQTAACSFYSPGTDYCRVYNRFASIKTDLIKKDNTNYDKPYRA